MVEIKQKDFTSGAYSEGEFRYHIKKGFTKEEKQQILQDHEDAKKLRIENQSLKYERVDLIVDGKKDRQIVKRLEEELDNIKNPTYSLGDGNVDQFNNWAINLLQKILEGEK